MLSGTVEKTLITMTYPLGSYHPRKQVNLTSSTVHSTPPRLMLDGCWFEARNTDVLQWQEPSGCGRSIRKTTHNCIYYLAQLYLWLNAEKTLRLAILLPPRDQPKCTFAHNLDCLHPIRISVYIIVIHVILTFPPLNVPDHKVCSGSSQR